MILHRARWVLPIAGPPLSHGWVLADGGLIVGVGSASARPARSSGFVGTGSASAGPARSSGSVGTGSASARPARSPDPGIAREGEAGARVETIDHGDAVILPGLVNAHTHLELSWMRGLVPPAVSMPAWVSRLMALRRSAGPEPLPGGGAPVGDAIREARAAGTSLVGDVTNTLAAYDLLAASDLGGAVFRELVGFSASNPEALVAGARAQIDGLAAGTRLGVSVVGHAPYSVSAALFRAIAHAAGDRPMSVHLAESADEIRFLLDGTGAWRDILGGLGVWVEDWQPPRCGPVEYLDRLGLVTNRLLAVHGTQLDDQGLARLAAAGATVVTCPRSNRWTGAGTPPIDRFYASGVRVAIGTDSLASVEDLNLFGELAALRRLAPGVPARRLLESATSLGAAALGLGTAFGTVEPGKRAELIAVRVPGGVEDVEEYLVGGIEPDAVTWIADAR